jgi:hypothetical protein
VRNLATYEGVIENGQVKLPSNVGIPEKTRVYVLVPDTESPATQHVVSPHLANPGQVKDFDKQIIVETTDANV